MKQIKNIVKPLIEEEIPFTAQATTLSRLGDELISNPVVALSEIIKNSYDADATKVKITFEGLIKGKGKINVEDDGHVMDENTVKEFWFRVSKSKKISQRISPKGRIQLGKKGIGRFSTMRISDKLRLKTKTYGQNLMVVAKFDWNKYRNNESDELDEIKNPFAVWYDRGTANHYTILEMNGLIDKWNKQKITKLISDLSSELISPVKHEDFKIQIICKDFPELSGELANKLLEGSTHKLEFLIDGDGNYTAILNDKSVVDEKIYPLICGPVNGVLYYFKDGLKGKDKKQAGVKIFRDGFLVRPYGCESDDWLNLKARKSNLGGRMLQPIYLVGYINISSETNPALRDMSNREGMFDCDEFYDFKDFITKQITILNKKIMDETYKTIVQKKHDEYKEALDTISEVLNSLSYSPILQKAVQEADRKYRGSLGEIPVFETALDKNGKKGERKTHEFNGEQKNKNIIKWPGAPKIKHRRRKVETSRTIIRKSASSISGKTTTVSGIVINPFIDYQLGENDVEAFISPEDRKLYINPNHPMFKYAEKIDSKNEKSVGSGLSINAPATNMHIYKSAAVAWASFHSAKEEIYNKEEFDSRYEEMIREISKQSSIKIS